eukprot:661598-Prymnesium_polylepis.1
MGRLDETAGRPSAGYPHDPRRGNSRPIEPSHACRVRWGSPQSRISPHEPTSRVSKPRNRAERAEKPDFDPKRRLARASR